jgi:hypothetical protein
MDQNPQGGNVKNRKIALAAMAIALPVVLVSTVGLSSAWAKKAPVAVAGNLTCNQESGTLTFNPPLSSSGATTGSEVTTVKVKIAGCSGNATLPKGGKVNSTISSTNGNSCIALAKPSTTPITLATAWSPKTIAGTSITFKGYQPVTSPTIGFNLGGAGTIGAAGSSYLGSDQGKSTTATSSTNMTVAQFTTACAGPKGLKTLKIVSGTVNLK